MNLYLLPRPSAPSRYDDVAEASAAAVLRTYSTSFGLASRLLAEPVRTHVRNVYALVRVADEIVDNPDPSVVRSARATMLRWLHEDTCHAMRVGYSGNPVVHAFARTTSACGIGQHLVDPFFASMAMDLDTTEHTPETFDRYVHGSAEVVGLMCLDVFLAAPDAGTADRSRSATSDHARLAPGAQSLGAAFQKLNFLRDLAEDHHALGRHYFPGLDLDRFCDADRDRILDDVATDLDAAAAVVPELPASSRRAVRVAHALFAALATRLRETPATEIRRARVRVPDTAKVRVVAGALYGGRS